MRPLLTVILLAISTPALAQSRVISDIECKTITSEGSSRVVCYDHAPDGRGTDRRSTTSGPPVSEAELIAARCARVEQGQTGWNIRGCEPTPRICTEAKRQGVELHGCPGASQTFEAMPVTLASTNTLATKTGPASHNPELAVTCDSGHLSVTLWPYTVLKNGAGRIKWDTSAPTPYTWVQGINDGTLGTVLKASDSPAFLVALQQRSTLAIEITPRDYVPFVLYYRPDEPRFQKRLSDYQRWCASQATAQSLK